MAIVYCARWTGWGSRRLRENTDIWEGALRKSTVTIKMPRLAHRVDVSIDMLQRVRTLISRYVHTAHSIESACAESIERGHY